MPADVVITNQTGRNTPEPSIAPNPPEPARTRPRSWRALREASGHSLRVVEDLTGINRGLLSRVERGFGPSPDLARRLLAFYDGEC